MHNRPEWMDMAEEMPRLPRVMVEADDAARIAHALLRAHRRGVTVPILRAIAQGTPWTAETRRMVERWITTP